VIGAPGEIRTPDLLVRSQTLYPTELRAHRLSAACGRGAAHFTLGSRPICKKQAARSVPKLPQDGVSGWRHCGARSMTVESSVSFSANDAHRPPVAWPCLASTSRHASTTGSTWRPGCFFNSSTASGSATGRSIGPVLVHGFEDVRDRYDARFEQDVRRRSVRWSTRLGGADDDAAQATPNAHAPHPIQQEQDRHEGEHEE
jgi:hypothetical protein